MIFRRIVGIVFVVLLSSGSTLRAQSQESVRKIPASQVPKLINHSPARKLRPAQRHTPVSTHIHGLRGASSRAPLRKPHFKAFGKIGGKPSIIRSHSTSVANKSGSVTLSVDVGRPLLRSAKVNVTNAPAGMKFSRLDWPALRTNKAPGLTRTTESFQGTDYPVLEFAFAVPDNASSIEPIFKSASFVPIGAIHFVPSLKMVKGTGPGTTKGTLERTFAGNSNPPVVSVSAPRIFRSLRMVTVTVPLVKANGAGFSALQKFTIGISFSVPSPPNANPASTRDPVFATLDRHLVANTWDLSSFAVPLRAERKAPPSKTLGANMLTSTAGPANSDTVTGWIDTNAAYIRLAVTRDGLYRVNASDLNFSTQGFSLTTSGWNARNVRCYNHGIEIPIGIDTDANGDILDIEFYGQHLRGFPLPTLRGPYLEELLSFDFEPTGFRSEYYNVATDTNVYWLTSSSLASSGNAPLRYAPKSAFSNTSIVSDGTILLHHERDLLYYPGDPILDQTLSVNMTEFVPGKRFVWQLLFGLDDGSATLANTHFTDTFYISQLPTDAAGKLAVISFLFRGTTNGTISQSIGHELRVAVDGITSQPIVFHGFDYDSVVDSVPLSRLNAGANIVTVTAGTEGDNPDQFYLDYYRVDFEEALAPSIDTGIAKGQWFFTASPTSRTFQLAMSDTSAHLYNLTDHTRIVPQSGTFIDSTSSPSPAYAAATSTSILRCDNIQPWNTRAPDVLTWQILNPRNAVDYLIIAHPNFLTAAERLAAMRTADGLRTNVVTTDEVFNGFDFGSNEAEAIRRYLTYAYYNYSGAPVSFVTLVGNASWDPKFNQPGDFEPSFVPTFGDPVSDYYFTIPEQDTSLDSLPLMLIGRIPVGTESQAEAYLSKLQESENAAPAPWDQHGLFLAGGDVDDHPEIDEVIREEFVPPLEAPPIDMTDTVIDRTDFTNVNVDATHIGEIQNLLGEGQSLMYFAGHGATFTSDIAFPDPSVLDNKGMYPLLMTLTCHTGAFAEPNLVTINQGYVAQPEAGSVQAYGTTGLGNLDYDNPYTIAWIALMQSFDSSLDSSQSINQLQLLTAAKISQIGTAAGGQASITHNETLQNSMLGDAAAGFALKPEPEFVVYANQVLAFAPGDSTPHLSFVVSDSIVTIRALIHNFGYAALTPVIIEIEDVGPNGFPTVTFDTLPRLTDSAFVADLIGLNAQSVGLHTIIIRIDPGHQFPKSDTSAEVTSIQILINGISTTAFYPYEGARGMCDVRDSTHFIVLTPAGSNPNDQVEIELDTTEAFSHPFIDRTTPVGTGYYVTFEQTLPASPAPSSTVYWWRTRLDRAGGGDTTVWEPASFSTGSAPRPEFSYTSSQQLLSTAIDGLDTNARGELYLPQQDTLRLEALSLGLADSEVVGTGGFQAFAQVFVNGKFDFQDSGVSMGQQFLSGFVILVWTPDGTQIDSVFQFSMTFLQIGDQSFEDSMANIFDSIIGTIPIGRRVMVLTVGSVDFSQFFFPRTEMAMQSLGSLQGMGPMTSDGSYALIGTKTNGPSPGTAKEAFNVAGSNGAHAFDTVVTAGTSGLAQTPFTAVANDYGSLTWAGDPIVSGENINFTVLGARRDGTGVDSVAGFSASDGNSFPLSGIDPRAHDQLAVEMHFIRTTSTAPSPALSGVAIQYDPAPEFTFAPDSVVLVPNVANTGGTVIAHYTASTLTCTPGDSIIVFLTRQAQGKVDTPAARVISINGRSSVPIADTLQTGNELGPVTLTATVNPNEAQNEQLLFNNTANGSYTVQRDTMSPTAEILFIDSTDGIPQHIPPCGYVSSHPTIQIQLISSNPLRDTSSSSISVSIVSQTTSGEVFLVSAANPNGFRVQFQSFPGGAMQAELMLTPSTPFPPGEWQIQAAIRDASGNVDTVTQCFTVSSVNGLEEVMNYPNPFKETTEFTFILKSDASANLKIIVYTIAGRKIRTLTPTTLHAGFNAVEWDGRDERGNEVANGTYLYRVVINGTNGDNVSQAVTQSAVRAR